MVTFWGFRVVLVILRIIHSPWCSLAIVLIGFSVKQL